MMNVRNLMAVSALVLVAACSIGKRTPTNVYTLRYEGGELQGCKTGASLRVSEPTAGPGLETRRIAILEDEKFTYYTGARWAAPAPELFQTVLVGAFENSGQFKSVSTDMEPVNADYTLLTDIRDYQVQSSINPVVKLKLSAKLVNANTNKVLKTIAVEKSTTPAANKMESIVAAFNDVAKDAAAEIVKQSKGAVPGCK